MFNKNHKTFQAIYNNKAYSVDEIWHIASSFKQFLNDNQLTILCADNDIFSLSIYLGALKFNSPIMLLNHDTDIVELTKIIKKFKPSFLISKNISSINCKHDHNEKIHDYNIFSFSWANENSKLINEDLSLLLPTSGSTGSAKFVKISKKNIVANTKSIIDYLKITKNDKTITTMPMSYSFGLSIINTYFNAGAKIILCQHSLVSREFWKILDVSNITSLSGVPYIFELLFKFNFFKKSYSSLKTITQAGGRLKSELKKEILNYSNKNAINFFIMYGQTEATARISYVPPDMLSKKIDSIGIPIPSTELHVEKNDSQEGELIFEGDNVSMGYANDYKDLYLGDSRNGILKTGDIGFKDSDGYFYITGRKKRFIKINGIRLSLDDAEKLIENEFCSTGIDVRCIGEDDNLILEYTCVNNIDNDLKNYLCKKIKIHHKYLTIARVKNIMRNSSGKKIYT